MGVTNSNWGDPPSAPSHNHPKRNPSTGFRAVHFPRRPLWMWAMTLTRTNWWGMWLMSGIPTVSGGVSRCHGDEKKVSKTKKRMGSIYGIFTYRFSIPDMDGTGNKTVFFFPHGKNDDMFFFLSWTWNDGDLETFRRTSIQIPPKTCCNEVKLKP